MKGLRSLTYGFNLALLFEHIDPTQQSVACNMLFGGHDVGAKRRVDGKWRRKTSPVPEIKHSNGPGKDFDQGSSV